MVKRVDLAPKRAELLSSLASDKVGRKRDLVDFLDFLRNVEPPYSILIDSPWGGGKTFFVKTVELILRHLNDDLPNDASNVLSSFVEEYRDRVPEPSTLWPLYFNAWRNDFHVDPLGALFGSIAAQSDAASTRSGRDIVGAAETVIDILLKANGLPSGLKELGDSIRGADLVEAFRLRDALATKIGEFMKTVLPDCGKAVVLFIDELDRCDPRFAVNLLEQSKSVLDREDVVIVYSADMDQLSKVAKGFYGDEYDGLRFLERFYDRRFPLRRVPADRYLAFVEYSLSLSDDISKIVAETADSLGLSMRDINRLEGLKRVAETASGSVGLLSSVEVFIIRGLLPVCVVAEHIDPPRWNKLLDGERDEGWIVKIGLQSQTFGKLAQEAYACVNEPLLSSDGSRSQSASGDSETDGPDSFELFVERCCTLVLGRERAPKSYREADDKIGPYVNCAHMLTEFRRG